MHRLVVALMLALAPAMAQGADVKILTAGAMKAVVLELVPQFEKETGHKAVVDNARREDRRLHRPGVRRIERHLSHRLVR
jgi:accessory colonization factor AcfC